MQQHILRIIRINFAQRSKTVLYSELKRVFYSLNSTFKSRESTFIVKKKNHDSPPPSNIFSIPLF